MAADREAAAALGRLVLERRQALHLTQGAVAARAKIPQSAYSDIEAGNGASWDTVRKLARVLRISLGAIDRALPPPAMGDPPPKPRKPGRPKSEYRNSD